MTCWNGQVEKLLRLEKMPEDWRILISARKKNHIYRKLDLLQFQSLSQLPLWDHWLSSVVRSREVRGLGISFNVTTAFYLYQPWRKAKILMLPIWALEKFILNLNFSSNEHLSPLQQNWRPPCSNSETLSWIPENETTGTKTMSIFPFISIGWASSAIMYDCYTILYSGPHLQTQFGSFL